MLRKWVSNVDVDLVKSRAYDLAKFCMPVLTWAPNLTKNVIIDDVIGGFIVGVMIVPTCLSWASLAGLPLSCGLSAALFALFSYGTFGQCGIIAMGPVAELTTLLISIPDIIPGTRKDIFQSIGVQVGILSVILSCIDGGKVIKTIFAKAVGDGYTCAAALLAISVQIKVMFNVTAPTATQIHEVIISTFRALQEQMTIKSIYAFLIFMTYTLYLIYIKKLSLPLWIPHQLIVVIVSTTATWFFRLDQSLGLAIVKDLPAGLSLPQFPPMEDIILMGPYTLTVTMVSFIQMHVMARRFNPDMNPNAELFASGITNFLCNIFSGMPVTNSFSCSSVLLEQHVHTPLTSYSAGVVVLIAIVFLTRLGAFYYLPKQALGSIVVASVWRLVDFSGPAALWRYSKKDAAVWIFTFVLTIFGGITIGVLSGIALSLVLVVLRIARPRAVTVGFNMMTFSYGDIRKDPELLVYPNILLWRFEAPLYFVNVGFFQERLKHAIENEIRPIDVVIVSCGKIVDIDAAALCSLPGIISIIERLDSARPRTIFLSDIHGRLEQVLLESQILPMYTPEEYANVSLGSIRSTGKFPVVFKKLEDAVFFAQRLILEQYGDLDTAPYPNVSFLTDIVVQTALYSELTHNTTFSNLPSMNFSPNSSITAPPVSPSVPKLMSRLHKLQELTGYSVDRELVGVIGVIRHAELTPKRKKKIIFTDPQLLHLAFAKYSDENGMIMLTKRYHKRDLSELKDFMACAEKLVHEGKLNQGEQWLRAFSVAKGEPSGLKIQIKPKMVGDKPYSSDQVRPIPARNITTAVFEVKWGGVLTHSGITQAHVLGQKLFARFFAAGDIPLERLMQFTKNSTVTASDEDRVVNTALVFMLALTQKQRFSTADIRIDDDLMKNLSPIAKHMLDDEYHYFERLLHISTVAAARHHFHIPGFRQLLLQPDPTEISLEPCDISTEETNMATFSRVQTNKTVSSQTFRSPLDVLEELKENLLEVARGPLPDHMLKFPMNNQETLQELRSRWDTMLKNFLGSKRNRDIHVNRSHDHDSDDNSDNDGEALDGLHHRTFHGLEKEPSIEGSNSNFRPSPSTNARKATTSFLDPSGSAPSRESRSQYDLSDVLKLRDYSSYDLIYNVPILKKAAEATQMETVERLALALERISKIMENMARVSDQVLIGINSSKRFIIGSLVCEKLVEKIYHDFLDIAKMDEARGVKELLLKAQKLYVKDNGGVENDVRRVVEKSEDFFMMLASSKSKARNLQEHAEAYRALLLRYPFIALSDGTESEEESRKDSFARLYFSSYLHVEGLTQCLFESATVEGFSRPSKEELEIAQQLYMKHLIFKVFRRRNLSFTDLEVTEALRRLSLLYRSDLKFELQRENLRTKLAQVYHSMYYVTMEVYLSMGDSDFSASEKQTSDPNPILTISSPQEDVLHTMTESPAISLNLSASHRSVALEDHRSSVDEQLCIFEGKDDCENASDTKNNTSRTGFPNLGASFRDHSSFHSDASHALQSPTSNKNIKPVSVMPTPQAGRITMEMKEMKSRVSTITPMRRVHEGLSLDDFQKLLKEVSDAAISQKQSES